MNYKGHLTVGLITSVGVVGSFLALTDNLIESLVCGITTLVFSLYPDLDTASKPSRYAFVLGSISILYFFSVESYIAMILTFLFIVIPKMFKHRGMAHTLKFGLLASVCWLHILMQIIEVENTYIIASGMIGYLTHLILDKHVRL